MKPVPLAKGLRGGDAGVWDCKHAVGFRQVWQGRDLLPAAMAEHRAAHQKQGHIGASFGGNLQLFFGGQSDAEFLLQADQGGDGVGGARSQAPLDGEALVDMHGDFGGDVKPL